jgi:hypothetical protein
MRFVFVLQGNTGQRKIPRSPSLATNSLIYEYNWNAAVLMLVVLELRHMIPALFCLSSPQHLYLIWFFIQSAVLDSSHMLWFSS